MLASNLISRRRFSQFKKKVVITGMGALTPLGIGVEQTYKAILDNKVAIKPVDQSKYVYGIQTIGCQTPEEANDPAFLEKYSLRSKDPLFSQANFALREALDQSGIYQEGKGLLVEQDKVGLYMSQYMSTYELVMYLDSLDIDAKKRLVYPALRQELAEAYGIYGSAMSATNACSASLMAIGDSARLVANGYYDVMIAGGFDKHTGTYHDYIFSQMGAYSENMSSPSTYLRAFDNNRGGTCPGDGGSFVVVESEEHALARGAKPICEISAYHSSAYGGDILKPSQLGIQKLLSNVTRQAKWKPYDIDVINAHATGTTVGDPIEIAAIKTYLGSKYEDLLEDRFATPETIDMSHFDRTVVNSLKGYFGHMIMAAGSTELVVTIRAMLDNIALATVNLDSPIDSDLCLPTTGNHQKREVNRICKISLGFGANNSILAVEKYQNS